MPLKRRSRSWSCRMLIAAPERPAAPDTDPDVVHFPQFIGTQPGTFETCDTGPDDTASFLYVCTTGSRRARS
jgi:hypothetical protein